MELLKNLYAIHSMSGQEGAMRKFIKKYVREHIEGAVCRQDHGNLYIVKGVSDTYPCVVAHLDQVQTKHSPDFRTLELDGRLFGFSAKSARQEGLGADDKNGIWVALKCLERFDAIKVALFKEEEIGCGGSELAKMDFFTDVRFAIQADRRNGGDLITDISGSICSEAFLTAIDEYVLRHGYKATTGLMTDVETLSDKGIGVSCINVSCGYYNPHTDAEYTDVAQLQNCLDFVMDIIENVTGVYPHKREKTVYNYYGYGSSYGGYDYRRDYHVYSRSFNYGGSKTINGWDDDEDDTDYEDPYKDVFIPDFKDYAEPDDAVWDFIWTNNKKGYDPYYIFDFIEADCETFGIDYDTYCDWVSLLYEYDEADAK